MENIKGYWESHKRKHTSYDSFSDKQKLQEFSTTKSPLQTMLKGLI